MRLPSPVAAGQPVSAKDYNALLAYIRMTTVSGGPGIRSSRSPGGTTLVSTVVPGRGGPASAATHPFKVSASGLEAVVKPGFCNNEMPEISGDPLDDPTPPVLTLTDDAVNYVLIKVEGTYDTSTGVETLLTPEVEVATSVPAEISTDTGWTGYAVIAEVTVSAGTVVDTVQRITTNLTGRNFGKDNFFFAA